MKVAKQDIEEVRAGEYFFIIISKFKSLGNLCKWLESGEEGANSWLC